MTTQMMTLWEKPVVAVFAIVIEGSSFGPNYEPCQLGRPLCFVYAISQLALLMSGS